MHIWTIPRFTNNVNKVFLFPLEVHHHSKKPALPTKLCRTTSTQVGKAFQAVGQAGAALHTMADLLKDLSTSRDIDEEAFSELRWATDLSRWVIKKMAHAIGRSMSAMVAMERHLWLNLTGIKKRDKVFLLDAPVLPSGLFSKSINTVVSRFWEAKRQMEAFDKKLPPSCLRDRGCRPSSPNPVWLLSGERPRSRVWQVVCPLVEIGDHAQQPKRWTDLRSIISAKKKS